MTSRKRPGWDRQWEAKVINEKYGSIRDFVNAHGYDYDTDPKEEQDDRTQR